ncbi:MAG: hypothetical protein NZZ41_01180 [Candidatus Dojkabacteria bacterium]|nr:hypothetical protein [Candidatus Dojkabacteria bacterium]
MPFAIRKSGDKWEVYNKDRPSRVYGTHSTRKKAIRQLRALYANYDESKDLDDVINESSELLFSLSKKYKIPIQKMEKLWDEAKYQYENKLKSENKKIDKSRQEYWNGVIQELKKKLDEINVEEAKLIMDTKLKYKESLSRWFDCLQTNNYVEAQKYFPEVIKSKVELLLNKKRNMFLKSLNKSKE